MNKFLTILFLSISIFFSLTKSDVPSAECDGNTLKYSIQINLSNYLNVLTDNFSEVENKTIYNDSASLKNAKGSIVKGSIYEKLLQNQISNYTVFDSYEEAEKALNNHEVDYLICSKNSYGDKINMESDYLTYIQIEDDEISSNIRNAIVMKNNSKNLEIIARLGNELNEETYLEYLEVLRKNWLGLDEGLKHVDKTIPENPARNTSFLLNFDQEPYAYYKNGEQAGIIPQALYYIGNQQNLNVTIKETLSNDDLIPAVKNGSVDRVAGHFLKSELDDEEIIAIDAPIGAETCYVIRYDNHEYSTDWGIADEIDEAILMDYMEIGMIFGQERDFYEDFWIFFTLIGYYLPNDMINDIFNETLVGGVLDINLLDYYMEKSDRITYFDDILYNNSYGILFKNETIKESFNAFLSENYDENKREELFDEWKNADESKTISYNTNGAQTLKVCFPQMRPLAYSENGVNKGYGLDLLNKFAEQNNYNLDTNLNLIEIEEDADIIVGYMNITGEKSENYSDYFFSDPILESYSVIAVMSYYDQEELTLQALYENYTVKSDNTLDVPMTISGVSKTARCVLPKSFSEDIITLNCSIPGMTGNEDISNSNIQLGEITDRIQIVYATIKANNLLKANTLFPDENILEQSDLDGMVCPSSSPSGNGNSTTSYSKKNKNSGLSTGGIIGITIPCCIVLVGVAALAIGMGTMGGSAAPVGVATDSSIQAMKINPQNINEVNASPGNNIMIQKNNIV